MGNSHVYKTLVKWVGNYLSFERCPGSPVANHLNFQVVWVYHRFTIDWWIIVGNTGCLGLPSFLDKPRDLKE